jgi:cation/acetate symporter
MAILVLARFSFNPLALFDAAAAKYSASVLAPGQLVSDPLNAISLGMSLMFGTAGLPHILMRFYTVPDAKSVRKSVTYATIFIGFFYLLTFILGFGAMVLVGQDEIKKFDAGGNLAAPMLAEVLGGNTLYGFIAAVSFATIMAVVAGLTISGVAALSHDLWVNVVRGDRANESEQLKVARGATVLLGSFAIILGMLFKGQNVAYMVGLAFAIAASAIFPALLLSMLWRRFTTNGAVASILVGTISSLVLIYLSPAIQIDILKAPSAPFPLTNPGLITIPLSFLVGIAVSVLAPESLAQEKFAEVEQQISLGVGAGRGWGR